MIKKFFGTLYGADVWLEGDAETVNLAEVAIKKDYAFKVMNTVKEAYDTLKK